MCSNKECADYFKKHREYHRCLEELRKKWKSYGRAAGKITLKQSSEEERRAIGGIVGKVFYGETISFSFLEFERGLQKTRFAPVDVKAVIEEYFGETLFTVKSGQRKAQERKENFLNKLYSYFEESTGRESAACRWIQELRSGKKYGYQLLIREYEKDEKQAELFGKNVGNAVVKLKDETEPENERPLAVFAAEITGNPHYFDRETTAGLLLIHAVCFCQKAEFPKTAYQWRELLIEVFLVPDNVSSIVHVFGLRLLTEQGWHLAYDTFCKRKEPCVMTMENMKNIIGAQAVGKKVFIVENEMVFSYILNDLKDLDYTLLCTSGQPRSVVQVLIPYIIADGAEIYYNGDFDPDGIRIADRLWQKFGECLHIWRMSPADYKNSLSKEKIKDIGKLKTENISHPILKKTAECMKEKRLAGYQENILKELLGDIKKITTQKL